MTKEEIKTFNEAEDERIKGIADENFEKSTLVWLLIGIFGFLDYLFFSHAVWWGQVIFVLLPTAVCVKFIRYFELVRFCRRVFTTSIFITVAIGVGYLYFTNQSV